MPGSEPELPCNLPVQRVPVDDREEEDCAEAGPHEADLAPEGHVGRPGEYGVEGSAPEASRGEGKPEGRGDLFDTEEERKGGKVMHVRHAGGHFRVQFRVSIGVSMPLLCV